VIQYNDSEAGFPRAKPTRYSNLNTQIAKNWETPLLTNFQKRQILCKLSQIIRQKLRKPEEFQNPEMDVPKLS
jgi:hypothetical protein